MRTVAVAFFVVFAGLGSAGARTAGAQGLLTLHWDSCESTTEFKSFSGPDTYRLFVTLQNFGEPNRGHEIVVGFFFQDPSACTSLLPDAWRFDAAGCQAGLYSATALSVNAACPTMGATSQSASYSTYELENGIGYLRLGVSYDPISPDPNSTYSLWSIAFDHGASTTGPSHDGLCGGAERRGCAFLRSGFWYTPESQAEGFIASHMIGWQDYCSFCDPAHPATWGALKSLYR